MQAIRLLIALNNNVALSFLFVLVNFYMADFLRATLQPSFPILGFSFCRGHLQCQDKLHPKVVTSFLLSVHIFYKILFILCLYSKNYLEIAHEKKISSLLHSNCLKFDLGAFQRLNSDLIAYLLRCLLVKIYGSLNIIYSLTRPRSYICYLQSIQSFSLFIIYSSIIFRLDGCRLLYYIRGFGVSLNIGFSGCELKTSKTYTQTYQQQTYS